MAPRKVTIIVLTWNGLAYTRRCLETLRAFTDFHPYEVIVVDNGSTDGTLEFLGSLPWVQVIENGRNLGFVRGNNIGILASDSESDCLLLNNDVEIYQPDWLARLQEAAYADKKTGIVGCRQVRPGGRLLHAGAYMPVETFWGQQIGGLEKDINQYGFTRDVELVSFACVYLKRAVIDDVGLLDEDYFSYFEDSDYCLKAREKGYAVLCCGEVTVVHHENVSSRVNQVDFSRLFKPSQKTFKRKWGAKLKGAYTPSLVWHSTVSRPIGYGLASAAVLHALEQKKAHAAYRYVYGPASPFPLVEPADTGDYQLNIMKSRPAPSACPQVVFAQGDAFEKNFGSYKIGFTMLEVDGLPREWVRQVNLMDEVWVPSPFNEVTFRESGVTRPIHIVPLGIDPNYFNPQIRGRGLDGPFTFMTNFEWGERKAPELLLKAFNDEFSANDDAVLLVKAVNTDPGVDVRAQIRALGLKSAGGRIEFLLDRCVPAYQLGSLYRSADCFVLASRGEGWGMPILEAMACGLPVIATDWSAQQFFMNERNAYPLRVRRLIPAVAKCPYYRGFRWADPDPDHLRHLMRYVYEHREGAREKGLRAAAEVASRWVWLNTASRIIDRLREISGEPVRESRPAGRTTSSRDSGRLDIGIDVSRAIGQPTGVGTYALNLVKGLARVDHQNSYTLYPGFGSFVHPDYPERAHLDLALPPNFQLYRGEFPAWESKRKPDGENAVALVHSTGNSAPDVGPAKLVMTAYDLTFKIFPAFHTDENIKLCEQGMEEAVKRAQMFIAISQSTKADLIRYFGVEPERISVVYPGIDPRFAPVGDTHALERVAGAYGLDRPYILFVGANEPRKNVKALLYAYHALRSEQSLGDHALVIVGGAGWFNADVHQAVQVLGLERDVKFLGYVAPEMLPAIYTACQVFVYPSVYEGFGLPVAEAMACGAPVVTSNVSSLPEVAGEAAILIDPHDVAQLVNALRAVLGDRTLRQRLRKRSVERAAMFSLDRMARETLKVYARVAKGASSS